MASFAEIRAKMNSQYGDSEEEKKKQLEQKRQTDAASSASSFESLRSKMESKYNPTSSVDQSFISTFVSDAEKYINSAQSDYDRIGFSTGSSVYLTRKKAADELRKRSFAIRQYLENNKSSSNSDDHVSLVSFLDDFDRASSQSIYGFYRPKEYYSQWDTEEDYNKRLQERKAREDMVNFDLAAGQKEIDDLETVKAEYEMLKRQAWMQPSVWARFISSTAIWTL